MPSPSQYGNAPENITTAEPQEQNAQAAAVVSFAKVAA